jgi:hypothetical protein
VRTISIVCEYSVLFAAIREQDYNGESLIYLSIIFRNLKLNLKPLRMGIKSPGGSV